MYVSSEGNDNQCAYALPVTAEALRTPLLRLQLLCESPDTSKEAVSEARSLLRLFDALQFAKTAISQKQQRLELEPLCLKPLYDDIFHQLEPLCAARNMRVENRLLHQPVLAHRVTTTYAVEHLVKTMFELAADSVEAPSTLTVHARTYDDRLDVGIYHETASLRAAEFACLRTTSQKQSGIHLQLAELLLSLQGSTLRSSIFNHHGGLAFSVAKSRQLALIV